MADDIESVEVEAPKARVKRPGYGGLSPVQAGLLYGGAASTVLGPLGILIGLGFGVAAKRMKQNFLDREAADIENVQAQSDDLQEQIDAEYGGADEDEKRMLDYARRRRSNGYQLLMSGDPRGAAMLEDANRVLLGIQQGDKARREADAAGALGMQRTLITSAAEDYRKQYQTALADADEAQDRTGRVLDLVNTEGFDPNAPLSKGVLQELISATGGMFRDTPSAWDAVSQGTSIAGNGLVGKAIQAGGAALSTLMNSRDFKVSREDYNRIALNIRKFSEQRAAARLEQLGTQAQQLDAVARKTGSIPDDYSLGDYISGGVKELRVLPVPPLLQNAPDLVDQASDVFNTATERLSTGPTTRRGPRRAARPVNGAAPWVRP